MRKIVLATIGSLGDLYPFIAIALALQGRGFEPVLAVPHDQIAIAQAAGIEGRAVLPSFETITTQLAMTREQVVERLLRDQHFLLERFLLGWLRPSCEALDEITAGACALVGSPFLFAAPIVATKRGIPLISAQLQPMALFSARQPPRTPDFRFFRHAPVGPVGLGWNHFLYGLARAQFRLRYGAQVNAVRRHHGLKRSRAAILLEPGGKVDLTLCCWSPLMGPLPRDAPPDARIIGFPMFDREDGGAPSLDPELDRFLAAGPAPLVFTLGSFAVAAPGAFYPAATAAAAALGRRAIMLTGDAVLPAPSPDMIVRRYVPHSLLFPKAAAIIHHGGIGTTAQALRAGKPQLVVPHMGDQHDNAARLAQIGVAATLAAPAFAGGAAIPALSRLLTQARYADAARVAALAMQRENGAESAAEAIDHGLESRCV